MPFRFVLVLTGLLALLPSSAQALELKNIRPCYGPLGATRHDSKFLPGDYLFVTFDIDGLKLDESKKASYIVLLEVFDAKTKTIYKKETPNVAIPQLGGTRIPGDFHVIMGHDHPPGQYKVRLTVMDVFTKEVKSFTHNFELLAKGFGIVGIMAPSVAFPGQPYMLQYNLIEMMLDANAKPNAKLEMKILDEAGQTVSSITNTYPKDLPENLDMKKANFIPIDFPIFPNRPGRFIVEINAMDVAGAKSASVRYPLNVLDIGALAGAPKQ